MLDFIKKVPKTTENEIFSFLLFFFLNKITIKMNFVNFDKLKKSVLYTKKRILKYWIIQTYLTSLKVFVNEKTEPLNFKHL